MKRITYPYKMPRYVPKSTYPEIFHYPTKRAPIEEVVTPTPSYPSAPADEMMVIKGKPAQSKEEWYFFKALLNSGVPFSSIYYQVDWRGGRQLGGQVLDFLVVIGGARFVFRVMGKYWHPTEYGSPLDAYAFHQLSSEGYIVKDIYDTQINTMDKALDVVGRMGF